MSRDESSGLRNAPLFLSQQGVDRLTEDAVSKMRAYAQTLGQTMQPLVLHADDANVLIAYTEVPDTSLVFLPDSPSQRDLPSTGNQGGVWVYAPRNNIRWHHLSDGRPADPPILGGSTLADFEPSTQCVGLVWGEVFEVRGESRLVEGQRFSLEDTSMQSPHRLERGDVAVGTVRGTSYTYAPEPGLCSHLHSSINRSLFLKAMAQDALEIGDRHALKHRTLPYDVLSEWLALKHPRMNDDRIAELFQGLVELLEKGTSSSPSLLEREALMDFGRVSWTSAPLKSGYLDIYGMTPRGASALLRFVTRHASIPFVVDWPFEERDTSLFGRMLEHPRCRSVLTRRGQPPSDVEGRSLLLDGSDMGVAVVRLGRSLSLSIELNAKGTPMNATTALPSSFPANAVELLAHRSQQEPAFTGEVLEMEEGRILAEALRLYPAGDEEQANTWEHEHPLAAWIASPAEHRPSRWKRLHTRLSPGWTDLLPVDALDLDDLPVAMVNGSASWRGLVLRRVQATSHIDPSVVLRWRHGLKSGASLSQAYATCLLCCLQSDQSEQHAAFEEATEVWFKAPMCAEEVLEAVFSKQRGTEKRRQDVLARFSKLALQQPTSTVLHVWAVGLGIAQRKEPWIPEVQRTMMDHLPHAWWAVFAGQWLPTQLGSHSGRSWLDSFSCSWVAQLARPAGEPTRFPGLDVLHPGFRLSTEQLLGTHLLSKDSARQHLRDLYEMVYAYEQGLPVPLLSIHPFAGWLVRPVDDWPRFDSEVLTVGDPKVGELLFARSFAAHTPTAGR